MWYKYIIIALLFYLFALLQNSFFSAFSLMGAGPNLVFLLFFELVFFSGKNWKDFIWDAVFYSIAAGIFLDIFSSSHIGASIILFFAVGFLIKKIQSALNEKEDKYPFVYFLALFLLSFSAYSAAFGMYLYFAGFSGIILDIGLPVLGSLVYNLFFACLTFFVVKKILGRKTYNIQHLFLKK